VQCKPNNYDGKDSKQCAWKRESVLGVRLCPSTREARPSTRSARWGAGVGNPDINYKGNRSVALTMRNASLPVGCKTSLHPQARRSEINPYGIHVSILQAAQFTMFF